MFLRLFYRYKEDNIVYYHIWLYTFTFKELEIALKSVGFRDISFYGDMAGKEYDSNNDTICVVTRK